jgi:FtsH-binding integral membrane protein
MVGSDRIGSGHYTDRSPAYPLFSTQTGVSIGVATALVVITLGLMWLFRGTVWAETTIWLYREAPAAPYPGLAVFGIVLTGGRWVGLKAAVDERHGLALGASAVVAVAYAAFGAGILSLYAPSIHGSALLITTGITTGITVAAAVVVYTTNHSFANWDKYSAILMFAGVGVIFLGSVSGAGTLSVVAFGLILLGWIVDLVFEIYMVSNDSRSPLANGIGVYIAFMGVFVHILQLVLEAMAEGD